MVSNRLTYGCVFQLCVQLCHLLRWRRNLVFTRCGTARGMFILGWSAVFQILPLVDFNLFLAVLRRVKVFLKACSGCRKTLRNANSNLWFLYATLFDDCTVISFFHNLCLVQRTTNIHIPICHNIPLLMLSLFLLLLMPTHECLQRTESSPRLRPYEFHNSRYIPYLYAIPYFLSLQVKFSFTDMVFADLDDYVSRCRAHLFTAMNILESFHILPS